MNTSFDPNYPQLKVTLDREKARTLGVPVDEVFQSMSAFLGGSFVNDFNRFGRLYRVYVQADAGARLNPEDIGKIYVQVENHRRNDPTLDAGYRQRHSGDGDHDRFNLLRSVEITGVPGSRIYVRAGDEDARGRSSRRRCRKK